jgi:hypothetical protein
MDQSSALGSGCDGEQDHRMQKRLDFAEPKVLINDSERLTLGHR